MADNTNLEEGKKSLNFLEEIIENDLASVYM